LSWVINWKKLSTPPREGSLGERKERQRESIGLEARRETDSRLVLLIHVSTHTLHTFSSSTMTFQVPCPTIELKIAADEFSESFFDVQYISTHPWLI
jgi:hypothetical protein